MTPKHQQFMIGVKGIICKDGKVLVLRPTGETNWELPGGRINEREDIAEAFGREMYEELGIKNIQPRKLLHAQLGRYKPGGGPQLMLLFFEATAQLDTAFLLSNEHVAWELIDRDTIDAHPLFASDKAAIQKFFARQQQREL